MRSYEIIILLAGSGAGQPGLVNTYFVAYIIETNTVRSTVQICTIISPHHHNHHLTTIPGTECWVGSVPCPGRIRIFKSNFYSVVRTAPSLDGI